MGSQVPFRVVGAVSVPRTASASLPRFRIVVFSRRRVFAELLNFFIKNPNFIYCHESLLPMPTNWNVSGLHTLLCNVHSCFVLRQVIRPKLVRTRSIARNGRQWVPSLCSSTATRTACVNPVEESSGCP